MLTEKVAYLKGLCEGMKIDTDSNEGKLLTEIIKCPACGKEFELEFEDCGCGCDCCGGDCDGEDEE